MKYGCCFNMLSKIPGGTGAEYLKLFRSCGYDYAELPLAEIMNLSEQDHKSLLEYLNKSGLPCESCNNFFPQTMRLTGPDVNFDSIFSYVDRAVAVAASLGAKNIVFGSGAAKRYPEDFSKSEAYAQIVRLLRYVKTVVAEYGITIAIEPLRKAECNLINTFEEGVRLARDLCGSHIKVLVDLFHMTEENEPASHIYEFGKGFLTHVHFANPKGRVFPLIGDGSGNIYRAFCDAVLKTGYSGRISCEAYTNDITNAAPKTLLLLKNYFEHNERK